MGLVVPPQHIIISLILVLFTFQNSIALYYYQVRLSDLNFGYEIHIINLQSGSWEETIEIEPDLKSVKSLWTISTTPHKAYQLLESVKPIRYNKLGLKPTSLFIIQDAHFRMRAIHFFLKTWEGFKPHNVFIFLYPFLNFIEKAKPIIYGELKLYNAQIHFILSYSKQQNAKTEFLQLKYFVCSFCPGHKLVGVPSRFPTYGIGLTSFWETLTKNYRHLEVGKNGHYDTSKCSAETHKTLHENYCTPSQRFVQVGIQQFNFSVLGMNSGEFHRNLYLENALDHNPIAATFLSEESYLEQYRAASKASIPLIREVEDFLYVYCENELMYPKTSYSYWISPFDKLTWQLIMISVTASLLVTTLKRGQGRGFMTVLQTFLQIAFKQSTDFKGFLPILISFCGIFLIGIYESVVTMNLTLPDSPILAKNLRELIVDRGYKLFFPIQDIIHVDHFDLTEFKWGFDKNNISENFLQTFQGLDANPSNKFETFANRSNFLATDVPKIDIDWELREFNIFTKGRFCHASQDVFFKRIYTTRVAGHGFQRFARLFGLLREFGFLSFWNDNQKWVSTNFQMRRLQLARLELINKISAKAKDATETETKIKALSLKGKISQLLQLFSMGIVLGVVAFVFEKVVKSIPIPQGALLKYHRMRMYLPG